MGLLNAPKYHWCETSLLAISSCFEACGVQRFYLQEVCAREQFCILLRIRNLWHCSISKIFHVMITFKQKTWLACGSHPDSSVGQWVKWVNRCDPLSTLVTYIRVIHICDWVSENGPRTYIKFDHFVVSYLANYLYKGLT